MQEFFRLIGNKVSVELLRFKVLFQNVLMLSQLRMIRGGPFQTVVTMKEKRHSTVFLGDLGIVNNSISDDLNSWRGVWRVHAV